MTTALAPTTMPGFNQPLKPLSDVVDVVQHLGELWDLASILHKSRMIPASIATPEAAVAIILKGRELGIGPMHAFDSISVIQGKPTISPQLMLALIERSGLCEDIAVEEMPEACTVTMKRRGRSPQRVTFTKAEAVSMGLWGKGNWAKMEGVMMYWRCVAKACRRVFPDVIAGCYTPEEMGALVNEDGEIIETSVYVGPTPPAEPVVVHGEVVEDYTPGRAPSITGKGSGLFTKEHVERTREFADWITKRCASTNKAWHAAWYGDPVKGTAGAFADALAEGHEIPQSVPDVINPHQAKNHLFKWALDAAYLDPSLADADPKTRQTDAVVARVFFEERAAVEGEMKDYVARQRKLKEAAIYRKHPDLAPAGWADEQAAAADRGDAWEPAEEALSNQ